MPETSETRTEARTLHAAIKKAARKLKVSVSDLAIEIIESVPDRVVISARLKQSEEESGQAVQTAGEAESAPESRGESLEPTAPREARVVISADGMEARLHIEPTPGFSVRMTSSDMLRLLKRYAIEHNVDGHAVEKALDTIAKGVLVDEVAARGTPPEPGKDGWMEVLFHSFPTEMTAEDAEEKLAKACVEKGAVLARRHLPSQGRPGIDVCGRPVSAPNGRDAQIVAGSGVKVIGDGVTFVATDLGYPVFRRGILEVRGLLTVEGDVDALRKPLDEPGHVLIKGSMEEGAAVRVGGNLFVIQHVNKADIEAGGDITVGGGITGTEEESVQAGGCLRTRYIQGMTVCVRGDLTVENSIQQCRVDTMGVVRVTNGRAQIISGDVRGWRGVEAGELGSPYARMTAVKAGPSRDDRLHLQELKRQRDADYENILKIDKMAAPFVNDTRKLSTVPPAKRAAIQQALEKAAILRNNVGKLEADIAILEEALAGGKSPVIVAGHKVWPGVEITIGDFSKVVESELGPSRFYVEGTRVVRDAVKPDE